jgi:HEAT repeat protein
VRVSALLGHDPWTFVRIAAANALGAMPAAPDLDHALADALRDGAPRVRVEVLEALGRHRANAHAEPVRERLDDEREPLEVRVAAISTLGAMCDSASLDTFTTAARRLTLPYPDRAELDLGVAAVKALAVMHPKDLERRLAPLLAKDVKASVREVATRAIAERGQCR